MDNIHAHPRVTPDRPVSGFHGMTKTPLPAPGTRERLIAALTDALRQDGMPLYLVGHSYGGHALGLLPRQEWINGAWTFATGAGWHGWMPPLERLRVLFLWRLLGPAWTRMAGYLPWSRLGMGEDLPLDGYRQWREWCRFPRYFFDDLRMQSVTARFDAVRFSIVAVNALDDAWAPPASRDAFMAGYRNAAVRAVTIDPRLAGLGPIGQWGTSGHGLGRCGTTRWIGSKGFPGRRVLRRAGRGRCCRSRGPDGQTRRLDKDSRTLPPSV